jgi:hypothetical protein
MKNLAMWKWCSFFLVALSAIFATLLLAAPAQRATIDYHYPTAPGMSTSMRIYGYISPADVALFAQRLKQAPRDPSTFIWLDSQCGNTLTASSIRLHHLWGEKSLLWLHVSPHADMVRWQRGTAATHRAHREEGENYPLQVSNAVGGHQQVQRR